MRKHLRLFDEGSELNRTDFWKKKRKKKKEIDKEIYV